MACIVGTYYHGPLSVLGVRLKHIKVKVRSTRQEGAEVPHGRVPNFLKVFYPDRFLHKCCVSSEDEKT